MFARVLVASLVLLLSPLMLLEGGAQPEKHRGGPLARLPRDRRRGPLRRTLVHPRTSEHRR
jgi:hypothetical protein